MLVKSFNILYTSYYKKSVLFVNSYVHDGAVAEDIVSESLIALWEQMKQKEIENIQHYLLKILKNRTLDYLKHLAVERKAQKAINHLLNRELDIRISMLTDCNPDNLLSNEIMELFRKSMEVLPQRTRIIFEMSRLENKTNKEIAELFCITVKGVDYHIALALQKLKQNLKDYLPVIVLSICQL